MEREGEPTERASVQGRQAESSITNRLCVAGTSSLCGCCRGWLPAGLAWLYRLVCCFAPATATHNRRETSSLCCYLFALGERQRTHLKRHLCSRKNATIHQKQGKCVLFWRCLHHRLICAFIEPSHDERKLCKRCLTESLFSDGGQLFIYPVGQDGVHLSFGK